MRKIIENLTQLRNFTGNAQIDCLRAIRNDLLKDVLEYTYNTHKKYKIDQGKFDKFYTGAVGQREATQDDWNVFKYSILDHLSSIKSAKDSDVIELVDYLSNFTMDYQELFKMVIFKDLRINMNIKKFQKVWPDFLVEPQVQLAQKFEGKSFVENRYSRKLDGLRCYYLDGVPMSRTNKPHKLEPFEHITAQIKSHEDYKDYVLDGEIIYLNPDGTEDFAKAISLARSDKRTPECDNLYFCVFDMIQKDKFLNKQPDVVFNDAYERLINRFGLTQETVSWHHTTDKNILILKQVGDDELPQLQTARLENNWEGLMIRNGLAPYEYKRTSNLLKMKNMQDTEVELVEMMPGTGKYQNVLGAFIANYNGFQLKIGSGFSDEQREEYWNNKHKYIGKYVKVKYFEKTVNQQGGESLRFPIFLCFRDPITMEEFITL